jgi:hypothetical protein
MEALFRHLESQALSAIDWYLHDKRSKARWSRTLRVLTILLTAGGGLVPLLRASGIETLRAEWGYVLLALAAACLGLDRFFGFSSAWMRYLMTSMALQRLLLDFQMDWSMANARMEQASPTPVQCLDLLQRMKNFAIAVQREVEDETFAWVTEFQSALARIEQQVEKEQARASLHNVNAGAPIPAALLGNDERVLAKPRIRTKVSRRRLFGRPSIERDQ